MGNLCFSPEQSRTSLDNDESSKANTEIVYANGDKYTGVLNQSGQREGTGVYRFANGDRYEGQWWADKKHGHGFFFYVNGEVYKGDW
jgi:hypothetical protein